MIQIHTCMLESSHTPPPLPKSLDMATMGVLRNIEVDTKSNCTCHSGKLWWFMGLFFLADLIIMDQEVKKFPCKMFFHMLWNLLKANQDWALQRMWICNLPSRPTTWMQTWEDRNSGLSLLIWMKLIQTGA